VERAWFARHPRFQVHYTPTSASWLNQVERALVRPARCKADQARAPGHLIADLEICCHDDLPLFPWLLQLDA
jgi:hypothetical protein